MSSPTAKSYDVFLSHNSKDKATVRAVADWLRRHEVPNVWLDETELEAGARLTKELGKAMEASRSAIVFIGPDGEGNWQSEEIDTLLNKAIKLARDQDEFRIIPVLLAGADQSKLRWFLQTRLWVDLSEGVTDNHGELFRLRQAILGKAGEPPKFDLSDFNPYRGLLAFKVCNAPYFFGRSNECRALAKTIFERRFACIIGASGNGKSSLAHAGLATDAAESAVRGIQRWKQVTLVPSRHLIRSLLEQLQASCPDHERGEAVDRALRRVQTSEAPEIPANAEKQAEQLNEEIKTWALNDEQPVVFVIDQLEEVFTHRDIETATEEQRKERNRLMLECLALLVQHGEKRWRFICTLREDFLHRCRVSPAFWGLLSDVRHVLRLDQLKDSGLREAIKGPAARAGGYLEAGLVETMLKDVHRQPGAMPLLQLVLQELWRHRQGACMTHEAYRKIGGITSVLQYRAKNAIDLLKADQAEYYQIARNLLLRLTALGEGVSDTRRRLDRSELEWEDTDPKAIQHVVAHLSDADNRLLVADVHAIEIAHEILIRESEYIRDWLDGPQGVRNEIPTLRSLTRASHRWLATAKDPTFLNAAGPHRELKVWSASTSLRLTYLEREYLLKSRKHRLQELLHRRKQKQVLRQSERNRILQAEDLANIQAMRAQEKERQATLFAWALVILLLLTMGLSCTLWWVNRLRNEARRNETASLAQVLVSQANQVRESQPVQSLLLAAGAVEMTRRTFPGENILPAVQQALRDSLAIVGGRPLVGHGGRVTAKVVSTDRRWLATGSEDRTVRLWDLRANDPISNPTVLRGHDGAVLRVAFSPNNRWLVTGSDDKTARLWDLRSSGSIAEDPLVLRGHGGTVWRVAFSPDNKWLLTGTRDGSTRLWDLHSKNSSVASFLLLGNRIEEDSQLFSPDGRWLVTRSDDNLVHLLDLRLSDPTVGALVLRGHRGAVWQVAFSPDNRWLLTGSDDGTACLWDLRSDAPAANPFVLQGHGGGVKEVAFSPEGRWLATVGRNGMARLWDLGANNPTADPRALFEGDIGGILALSRTLAFSPNGQWLATKPYGTLARLWDLRSPDPAAAPRMLNGHADSDQVLAFSSDGRWLVIGGFEDAIRLWDLALGDPGASPHVLRGHKRGVDVVAFSKDTHWLAVSYDDKLVKLWDLDQDDPAADSTVLRGHEGSVLSMDFSVEDRFLVTEGMDSTVRLWEFEANRPLRLHRRNWDAFQGVKYSPDSMWLATRSFDNSLRLLDLRSNTPSAAPRILEVPRILEEDNDVNESMVFSSDARWMATLSSNKTVRLWDLRSNDPTVAPRMLKGYDDVAWAVAFSPDCRWVASVGRDKRIHLRDLRSKDLEATSWALNDLDDVVSSICISPDARWFATVSRDKQARLWALRSNQATATPQVLAGFYDAVHSLAFSPDGRWLATVSHDHKARLWGLASTDTSVHPRALEGYVTDLRYVVFSHDGRWVAAMSPVNGLRLWDLGLIDTDEAPRLLEEGTGGPPPVPLPHTLFVDVLRFSADGRWLAAVGKAGAAQLWDLRSNDAASTRRILTGNAEPIRSVMFSRDGRWFAALGKDGTARLWDMQSNTPIPTAQVLKVNDEVVQYAAFSPDARWFTTVSVAGTSLWPLKVEDILAAARRAAGRNLSTNEWKQLLPGQPYFEVFPGAFIPKD